MASPRDSRRLGRWPLVAVLAFALVAAVFVWRDWKPFLTTERDVVTATPSLAGIFTRDTARLRPGQEACVSPVSISTEAGIVQLLVNAAPAAAPPPPLEVAVAAVGYRAVTTIEGYERGADVYVRGRFDPPQKDETGMVCVANRGREPVELVGTAEQRSNAPAVTRVGEREVPDVALTLFEPRQQTLLSRPGEVIANASAFTGGLLPVWLLWPVAVLMLLLALAGVPWALWRTVREDVAERPLRDPRS